MATSFKGLWYGSMYLLEQFVELIVKLLLFHVSGNDFSILQQNDIWQGLESQFVQSFVFQHLSVSDSWSSDGISLDVLFAVVFAGVQA